MTNSLENNTVHKITPWEQVDIGNHYMFRLVMENPELCKIALERILDIKITKLDVLVAEKSIEYKASSRGIRLDIYAVDSDGIAYDLEMQSLDANKNSLGKRTRYYQSLLDGDALKKNVYYSDLRKSYVIFICKFDPFDKNFGRYTFNSWCDEDKTVNLCDAATKILLNTKGDKSDMSKELRAFLEYIDTNSPKDEYTQNLANTVAILHKDEGARNLYMTIEQQMMDERAKVREEMLQYVVEANKRASNAEKKAADAEQEAAEAKQKATDAEKKATDAEHKCDVQVKQNILNIISLCKSANFSEEQTIAHLMDKAFLTKEEAIRILDEY